MPAWFSHRVVSAAALCFVCCPPYVLHAEEGTRLLRNPAVSGSQIAFVYANDIWTVGLDGGSARRLTSFEGAETEPHFSPDGRSLFPANTAATSMSMQSLPKAASRSG